AEARMAIFQFIEGWYNPGRRHSALGYMSPINYEKSIRTRLAALIHEHSDFGSGLAAA
ncbi:MAG TPA: IS3 family transposase, partial [Candidatus Limnocylindrales bacterium]|nr:IS3 family transposase [Candidatus Limnocylindrales bacterium]